MTTEALAAISPHLHLKISKRARRIALRLDTSARVMNLVVPQRFNMKKAEHFAAQHQLWIREKLAELPERIGFAHGTVIPVFGKDRLINITYDPERKLTSIRMTDDRIEVLTNQQDPTSRITRFLKQESRAMLTGLAREKALQTQKPLKEVQIRDTKSRWGSCGPDGRISFSWRLIFAPWEAMDYVVAHEAAHLVHMNHGKQFWALCAALSADYGKGKRWMRENGHELQRYGASGR